MDADLAEPVRQSLLIYYYQALGPLYILLLPMSALVGLALTLLLVIRGRGALVIPALLFAVSLPLQVGVYGVADGMQQSIMVIASSPTMPKPSELAQAYSMAFISAQVGMVLMLPIYLTAIAGTLFRAVLSSKKTSPGAVS